MDYNLVITLTNGVEHEFMISIPDGVDGASFQAKGSVATKKDLPDVATAEIGDSYIVEGGPESEAGHLYILGTEKVSETATPHLAWIDMGRIVGRDGKDGTVADFDQNQFTTKVVGGKTVITIKNDPDSSNQLSVIGKEGLFVRPASAQVRAKDKSVRVAGIPQDKNGGFNTEVSVNAIPVKNNQLGIRTVGSTEGLYVQSAHEELLSPNKTLSIKTSATEVPFEPAKTDIDVAISKEDGNSLVIKEDGLFSAGGGGGDLDSKYIKISEAVANPEAAVGGGDGTIVIGSGAHLGSTSGSTAPPSKATVVGATASGMDDSTAVGYHSVAVGKQGVAVGRDALALGDYTVCVGYKASSDDSYGIAVGHTAQSRSSCIAIGFNAEANESMSIAVGPNSLATDSASIAVGHSAKAREGGLALGHASRAEANSAVAIGPSSRATHTGSVAIGNESSTAANWEVSFGNELKRRKLTNVSDGENPYDAVNVKQLKAYKLKRKVTSGNFSWNYMDSKTAANAAGKVGKSCYLKITLTLYGEDSGNADIVPKVELQSVPCKEDGTLIPYTIYVGSVSAHNNTTPKVTMTLVMQEIPTHLMDISRLEITPVARGDNGLSVGIPEIPITEPGVPVNEPRYIVSYYVLG